MRHKEIKYLAQVHTSPSRERRGKPKMGRSRLERREGEREKRMRIKINHQVSESGENGFREMWGGSGVWGARLRSACKRW